MHRTVTPSIARSFKGWLKNASLKERKKFADDVNAIAGALAAHEITTKPVTPADRISNGTLQEPPT